MKHCYKSVPEPQALEKFRLSSALASWDDLRNRESELYRKMVSQLQLDQKSLCVFCEISLGKDNTQVAHFHPKSDKTGDSNWALEWTNLWLCCKGGTQPWHQNSDNYLPPLPENMSCDEKKGAEVLDDKILRPDEVPAFPRVFSYVYGDYGTEIKAEFVICSESGVNHQRAHNTITMLNLNCPRLAKARAKVLNLLEHEISIARKAGTIDLENSVLPQKWLSKTSEGKYRQFFTLIRWRLAASAESYLRESGYVG